MFVVILIIIIIILFVINYNNYNNVVWSKGYPLKLGVDKNYIFSSTEKPVTLKDLENQKSNIIWVKMGSNGNQNLKLFLEYLKTKKYQITLITTDGDNSIPDDVDYLLFNEIINNVKMWYSQNVTRTDILKLKHIPIGLDLHTSKENPNSQIKLLLRIRDESKDINLRINKVYCDVHLSPNKKFGNPREEIKKYNLVFQDKKIPRELLWKKYSEYIFVISTHGNGLDCHRTWELLLLGNIVITKKSGIDALFIDLPVVIVNSWSEINDNNLLIWFNKYNHLTNKDYIISKLKFDTWVDLY